MLRDTSGGNAVQPPGQAQAQAGQAPGMTRGQAAGQVREAEPERDERLAGVRFREVERTFGLPPIRREDRDGMRRLGGDYNTERRHDERHHDERRHGDDDYQFYRRY